MATVPELDHIDYDDHDSRSNTDTASETSACSPYDCSDECTTSSRRRSRCSRHSRRSSADYRGGRRREEPPAVFGSLVERRAWEQERLKKDNHNTSTSVQHSVTQSLPSVQVQWQTWRKQLAGPMALPPSPLLPRSSAMQSDLIDINIQGHRRSLVLAFGAMASAVARAYNGGLGAVPPAGSRGTAPGQGVGGRSPPPRC